MKTLIATLMLAAPLLVVGQSAMAQTDSSAKAKAAAAKKAPAKKAAAKKGSKAAVGAAAGAGAATAVAAGPASKALSTEELAVSERVFKGRIPCELGAYVNVLADSANPGYFIIDGRGFKYHMAPVSTSTGAVRLEDRAAGAVWIQIANKSMLMNQRAGQRLADECMSPEQVVVAEAIKKNPPVSVLDPLPAAK